MTRIRMLALDLDGTLAAEGNEVSPATRDALADVGRHLEVTIATGRRFRTANYVRVSLEMPVHLVCYGGALVEHKSGDLLWSRAFPDDQLEAVVRCARKLGHCLVAQHHDPRFPDHDFTVDEVGMPNEATAHYLDSNPRFGLRADLAGKQSLDTFVVGAFGSRHDLADLKAALEERLGDELLARLMSFANVDEQYYCEVTRNDVDKWHGLMALASELDITADQICAVGDEINDIEMISGAGLGAAMANGHPDIRRAASWICGRHDEDGLVPLLDHLRDHCG